MANKRCLEDFLEREIARAVRHARPLSLVLFDVDRFKLINDDFGHLAGDRVLQGIASVAAKEVRRDELIARYGLEAADTMESLVGRADANLDRAKQGGRNRAVTGRSGSASGGTESSPADAGRR